MMQIRKYRFHIALVALIIIGISFSCAVLIYTTTERFTLLGIIIAIVTFVFDRIYERKKNHDEANERLDRCYSTIEKELVDHIEALRSSDFDKIEDNKGYPFKSMFFNIDAYESLLNSGLFTHFPTLTQFSLANLYTRIKLHNEYQVQRSVFKANFQIQGSSNKRNDWSLITIECDKILNRYQKQIFDIAEDLINLIDVEKSKII